MPGVWRVYTRSQLLEGTVPADDPGLAALRSFDPERSGDLVFQLRPGWLFGGQMPGTTHGQPWSYDTRVPIVLFGPGVRPGARLEPAATVDVAPTLAALMHIGPPGRLARAHPARGNRPRRLAGDRPLALRPSSRGSSTTTLTGPRRAPPVVSTRQSLAVCGVALLALAAWFALAGHPSREPAPSPTPEAARTAAPSLEGAPPRDVAAPNLRARPNRSDGVEPARAAATTDAPVSKRGRVRDAKGVAIGGASVSWREAVGAAVRSPEARSDDAGAFSIGAPPTGDAVLVVAHPGFVPVALHVAVDDPRELDVVLKAAASLRLRIVDGGGTPLPGVTLLVGDARDDFAAAESIVRLDDRVELRRTREVRADDEGRVTIPDLDPARSVHVEPKRGSGLFRTHKGGRYAYFPTAEEQTVELTPCYLAWYRAVDAASGQQIRLAQWSPCYFNKRLIPTGNASPVEAAATLGFGPAPSGGDLWLITGSSEGATDSAEFGPSTVRAPGFAPREVLIVARKPSRGAAMEPTIVRLERLDGRGLGTLSLSFAEGQVPELAVFQLAARPGRPGQRSNGLKVTAELAGPTRRFAWSGIPAGDYTLSVGDWSHDLTVPENGEIEVPFDRQRVSSLRVRVRHEGVPYVGTVDLALVLPSSAETFVLPIPDVLLVKGLTPAYVLFPSTTEGLVTVSTADGKQGVAKVRVGPPPADTEVTVDLAP